MRNRSVCWTALCLWAALSAVVGLAAAAPSAEQIVGRSLDNMVFRTAGAQMTITMTLANKRGETRQRTLFARTQRFDGLTRTLVRFLAPSNVAGTAFLFLENKKGQDDQYMYLPAIKAVRRVAGKQKQGRFMGSDFTFADLEWQHLDQATYKMVAKQKVGKHPCYVVDSRPRHSEDYSRVRFFIRQTDLAPLRVQFFDRQKDLKKTLYVKAFKNVEGTPLATRLKMVDQQQGHSTFLALDKIQLGQDMSPEAFSVHALGQR